MRKPALAFAFAASLFALTAWAGEWTGYVSESKCGAAHMDGSAKSIACVKNCVKAGAKPVFVTEDKKILTISNPSEVTNFLGKKVSVSGSVDNDSLTVESIKAAK